MENISFFKKKNKIKFYFLFFIFYSFSLQDKKNICFSQPAPTQGILLGYAVNDEDETNKVGILESNISDTERIKHQVIIKDSIREKYPLCSLLCEEGWLGDGWCDYHCNNELCNYDDGDCEGWCSAGCRPGFIGDGFCDVLCFNEKCKWDENDCLHLHKIRDSLNNANMTDVENFDYSKCECPPHKLNNDKCDYECNNFQCNLDKHHCYHDCDEKCPYMWIGDNQCDFSCDTDKCFHDKGDCIHKDGCNEECKIWMKGNEICDNACYNSECAYDDGDCDGIVSVEIVDYTKNPVEYIFCAEEFIGDGHCDFPCFNAKARWDEGDCDSYVTI